MTLTYYEKYWNHTSSDRSKERKRLTQEDIGGKGDPIGAQTAMVQDGMLEKLKKLFDQAGIEDWVAHIDHTLTYQAQKQEIIEDFGAEGFAIDKKEKLERLEEEQSRRREEAPDEAPITQEERMKRMRYGDPVGELDDDVETIDIGDSNDDNIDTEDGNDESGVNEILNNLSLKQARQSCTQAIEEVYETENPTIIDALPGMGKTYGAIKSTHSTESQISILVGRGNKGQYAEMENWCDQFGLSYKRIPSSYRACPTISGNHGKKIAEEQKKYLNYGVTASSLHKFQDLPCEENGSCPYIDEWNFDPVDYDVLIGHYTHAYVSKVVENRTVIFDEFPGDIFISELNNERQISKFLKDKSSIPFKNYIDLLTNRDNKKDRQETLDWFQNRGFEISDVAPVLLNNIGARHALAPLAVLGLLQMTDLGNGWESGPLREREWAVLDKNKNIIYLLRPPNLSEADNVVALSGTPEYRFWELVLGMELDAKRVLNTEERRDYVWNVQNLRIIQTEIEAVFSYSGGNADIQRDAALIEEVADKYDLIPTIITSKKVRDNLENFGVQFDDDSTYYGNIRGSNKLADKEVGIILGSPHPGDDEIKKWAAFFGESVGSPDLDARGKDTSYGIFGDRVFAHLRENEVLQSIFRFARDGSGATVYVNTAAIPSWVPRELSVGVIRKRTATEKQVIETLSHLESGSGSRIANEADVNEDTARKYLRELKKEKAVEKTGKTKGVKWHDRGLSSVNERGVVDLTPLTEPLSNISIRDRHEKSSSDIEEAALAEQQKARKILEQQIEELRDPSSDY